MSTSPSTSAAGPILGGIRQAARIGVAVASAAILFIQIARTAVDAAEAIYDTSMGGCKTFNLTTDATADLTISQFASVFDTTECMRVTVHVYDPIADIWNLICFGDFKGQGTWNETVIPRSLCTLVSIPPDTTMTFRLEYTVCNDNCLYACDCKEYFEEEEPSLSHRYTYKDAMCDTDTTCPAPPTPGPTVFSTDAPTSKPSSKPSSGPSDGPSSKPSSDPTGKPSTQPSSDPSLSPTSIPSDMPSAPPSVDLLAQCSAAYDMATGNIITCGENADCGGFGPDQLGATCNPATCECECDTQYCLEPISQADKTCQLACNCEAECNTDPALGNKNKGSDRCGLEGLSCTSCLSDPNICGIDQDCITQKNQQGVVTDAYCVGSGICTASKAKMCDLAYNAMSGSPNQRAKCCPATSGCIKIALGVIQTSTCGAVCGTSCLTSQSNPGNYGYSPATFCIFGQRVDNMPYCPVISDGTLGQFSCTGGNDVEGDNSICCNELEDDPPTQTDGWFECNEGVNYGYNEPNPDNPWSPDGEPVCIDPNSLTYIPGRIPNVCAS